ncbi:hypothetical protein BHE74_00024804 [Ensete ventricosum]|uniref:Uncharacterized protein n=1 Tax=Ensete ventricosum TaxID=4639 RepID=A0A427A322_ENSVE|nr:hypothetical protein B296_00023412 [Ensete ventricosum]RWW67734.1 hypothetical protein BHE74_00024804 [Ensete ventricosum]
MTVTMFLKSTFTLLVTSAVTAYPTTPGQLLTLHLCQLNSVSVFFFNLITSLKTLICMVFKAFIG